mmetsp:Transcript_24470/g.28855  ORF Transcript_24470/g.28855 Transcript_24470/m.28855 type:complete len:87 (-) Transcript_24470:430-690(-)
MDENAASLSLVQGNDEELYIPMEDMAAEEELKDPIMGWIESASSTVGIGGDNDGGGIDGKDTIQSSPNEGADEILVLMLELLPVPL